MAACRLDVIIMVGVIGIVALVLLSLCSRRTQDESDTRSNEHQRAGFEQTVVVGLYQLLHS